MNNDIYSFDKCYQLQVFSNDVSLNEKYSKRSVRSVKECEAIAFKNDNDFFLVNDISNSLNTTYTNCYTPKIESKSGTIEKSWNFFKELFFSNETSTTQKEPIDICDNLLYNEKKTDENKKCFKYSLDDKVYAPKKYFAYYGKPVLNEKNIAMLKNIPNPSTYKRQLDGLKSYEDLIKLDPAFITNGPLTTTFKNFICDPTIRNERALDEQILNLKGKYDNLYTSLSDISRDLSNLSYLNSFDDDTIKSFNGRINTRNIELNSLLGSGGANNGRLDDTTFLTQFKIVENSILILIVISAIFIYSKKQT